MSNAAMEIKDLPDPAGLEWETPSVADGRHLSADFLPLSEYLAMRKRIGGRQSFMPKTNFSPESVEMLSENNIMKALEGRYVLSSQSMEPDAILFLLEVMEMYRPRVVLELGSGLSTLILADAHAKILKADKAEGSFVTLEQSEDHLMSVKGYASAIKADKHFTGVHMPMVRYKIGEVFGLDEKALPCFDLGEAALHKALGGIKPDMIIVDGPSDEKSLQGASFAKMLTMPILSAYTAPGAAVFMTGAYADTEIFAMEQWRDSGALNVLGVKAVGKGMMIGIKA